VTQEAISPWVGAVMAPHWTQRSHDYAKARRRKIRKMGLRVREPDPGVLDAADPELG
jgi:hypothetical protein